MSRTRTYQLTGGILLVAVVAIAVYLRSGTTGAGGNRGSTAEGDPLHKALDVLEKGTDVGSLRVALQHFNTHFTQNRDDQAPPLTEAQLTRLRTEMGLTEAELAEITSPSYTAFDSHYLEYCYLLRDAVKALELRGDGDRRAPPEKEAEAAFAWVCAQIRLEYPPVPALGLRIILSDAQDEQLDPHFVLLRGYGKATARAIAFLGLLQQLGLDGCLLAVPGKTGEPPRYWACGVLGSKNRLYLFDPRMGMPLPSADGGIATLGEVLQKDSPVLKLLDQGPDHRYDVSADQAAASEIYLAPQFGALAPRMGPLQKLVTGPESAVRVAPDLWGAEKRLVEACRATGQPNPVVRFVPGAARLQRDFYPESEGGSDTPDGKHLRARAIENLAYIHLHRLLLALPVEEGVRPDEIEKLFDQPRKRLFDIFVRQFQAFFLNPGKPRDVAKRGSSLGGSGGSDVLVIGPRDLTLRGRYQDAARVLDDQDRIFTEARKVKDTVASTEAIINWFKEAERAFGAPGDAAQRQALIESVDQKHGGTIGALVVGTAAEVRLAQIGHLLSLVAQAQAERQQFRLDNFAADVRPEEFVECQKQWREVDESWKHFLTEHGNAPEARGARIQRARAQEAIGRLLARRASLSVGNEKTKLESDAKSARELARRYWSDLGKEGKDLQSLGARYRAELLAREAGKK